MVIRYKPVVSPNRQGRIEAIQVCDDGGLVDYVAYKRLETYAAELELEIERLRCLVPRPDLTQDEIVWRDHMRGVHLAALAKEFGVTQERMRHKLKRIEENRFRLAAAKAGGA